MQRKTLNVVHIIVVLSGLFYYFLFASMRCIAIIALCNSADFLTMSGAHNNCIYVHMYVCCRAFRNYVSEHCYDIIWNTAYSFKRAK